MLEKIEKVIDWLGADFKYSNYFDGSNFTFLFCVFAVVGCLAILFSKNLRSKFF